MIAHRAPTQNRQCNHVALRAVEIVCRVRIRPVPRDHRGGRLVGQIKHLFGRHRIERAVRHCRAQLRVRFGRWCLDAK